MNDLNENTLNPNCFEKTKEAWGIFSFFLPQMLKRRMSALLPITNVLAIQKHIKKHETK